MHVNLVEYDETLFDTAISLRVSPDQVSFVDSNDESLTERESAIADGFDVRAFLIEDCMIPCGVAMLLHSSEHSENPIKGSPWYLWRFMVDERFQGKGISRKALIMLIDYMKEVFPLEPFSCSVSYEADNDMARRLYSSLGFHETGQIVEDEVVAFLD